MQARAAVRKMLWMLFSDVKAEHSRYASAPSCLAMAEPWDKGEEQCQYGFSTLNFIQNNWTVAVLHVNQAPIHFN